MDKTWYTHLHTHTFLQSSKLTCLLSHNVTFIYFLVIEAKSYSLGKWLVHTCY